MARGMDTSPEEETTIRSFLRRGPVEQEIVLLAMSRCGVGKDIRERLDTIEAMMARGALLRDAQGFVSIAPGHG